MVFMPPSHYHIDYLNVAPVSKSLVFYWKSLSFAIYGHNLFQILLLYLILNCSLFSEASTFSGVSFTRSWKFSYFRRGKLAESQHVVVCRRLIKIATCRSAQKGSVVCIYIGENNLHKGKEENVMRHLILAITIIALIVYSTNIIGCRSTVTPSGSTYSSEEGKSNGAPGGRGLRSGLGGGGGGRW